MTIKEIIIAVTIHLIIPFTGVLYFLRIKKAMQREKLENAPTTELFIIFATYGGLLLIALTTIFWKWSGMASIGAFYLILLAPFIMGYYAYRYRQIKRKSKYHIQ